MSTTCGPQWPGLDDVAAARSAAAHAGAASFGQATAEAVQTETAYIAGVSRVISQQCQAAAEAEPEAGG